ncbi:hypothetical protein GCM10020360_17490 [Nonlabens tegetincola]
MDWAGAAPRWGGGSAAVFATPTLSVSTSLHVAGSVRWMNDVVCGTTTLETFPGARNSSEDDARAWLAQTDTQTAIKVMQSIEIH